MKQLNEHEFQILQNALLKLKEDFIYRRKKIIEGGFNLYDKSITYNEDIKEASKFCADNMDGFLYEAQNT